MSREEGESGRTQEGDMVSDLAKEGGIEKRGRKG